jgi:hypothetical protein
MLFAGPATSLAWLFTAAAEHLPSLHARHQHRGQDRSCAGGASIQAHAPPSTRLADRSGDYGFGRAQGLRRLCRRTSHGEFVGPAILSFNASAFADIPGRAWTEANCPAARHDATVRVCTLAESGRLNGGLENATIYGEDSIQEVSRRDPSATGNAISAWISAGRPVETASAGQDGIFTTQADRLHVSQAQGLAGPAGEPFGVICADRGSALRCTAAGTLANGMQVRFKFRPGAR